MKTTIKYLPETFTPVTIELTIESEEELRTLFTLAGAPCQTVLDISGKSIYEVQSLSQVDPVYDLYSTLSSICAQKLV